MEPMHHHHEKYGQPQASWTNFIPLITIIIFIVLLVLINQWRHGIDTQRAMLDGMGFFFLIFACFKIINLRGFADAYGMYDLIAQQSRMYAYAYPFIELILGIAYLNRSYLAAINWVTLVLMVIGSAGVLNELRKGKQITCACLGTVFKIPMTYVTLAEDVIMGAMALYMIITN